MSKRTRQYARYVKSVKWFKIRADIVKRDGNKCIKCGSKKRLQVHHLHYKNIFNEKPEDLVTLCNSCHEEIHNKESLTKKIHNRKVKAEGDKCKYCNAPVIKIKVEPKEDAKIIYSYHLICPDCRKYYFSEKYVVERKTRKKVKSAKKRKNKRYIAKQVKCPKCGGGLVKKARKIKDDSGITFKRYYICSNCGRRIDLKDIKIDTAK